MQRQREEKLVLAFRKLSREKQDLYLNSICDCAVESERSRPGLKLVSDNSALVERARLYGTTEQP